MNVKDVEKNIASAAKFLKALSNEKRLAIICALHGEEKSVGALESVVGLSQSALSQHLARLRRDGLLLTRREAQTIYYQLNGDMLECILECLSKMYGAPE